MHAHLACAGMVILHPDLLLSGTRVSGSFRCQRQSVLEERFASSSNDKAVEGTLMHEVFQVVFCVTCADLNEVPVWPTPGWCPKGLSV